MSTVKSALAHKSGAPESMFVPATWVVEALLQMARQPGTGRLLVIRRRRAGRLS